MTATDDLPPPTPAVPAAPTVEPSEAEIDYEGLGENVPLHINMVAGSLAGITEHAVMFPVDVVRTRMQVLNTVPDANYASMTNDISRIWTGEGFRALWRGIASVILGAGPAHALYFGTYELVKESTGGNREGHQFTSTAFAGAAATVASDAFMNPFDGAWRLSLTSNQTTHAALWLWILVSFSVCTCIVPRRGPPCLLRVIPNDAHHDCALHSDPICDLRMGQKGAQPRRDVLAGRTCYFRRLCWSHCRCVYQPAGRGQDTAADSRLQQ